MTNARGRVDGRFLRSVGHAIDRSEIRASLAVTRLWPLRLDLVGTGGAFARRCVAAEA